MAGRHEAVPFQAGKKLYGAIIEGNRPTDTILARE